MAVGFWSPRVRGDDGLAPPARTAPRTRTFLYVARFPVVCTADRLRSSKTPLRPYSPQSTQSSCGESVMYVPSPVPLLSLPKGRSIVGMYRVDTSERDTGRDTCPAQRYQRGAETIRYCEFPKDSESLEKESVDKKS